MPEGGTLEVSARVGDEDVFVEFADTGVGIPEALLDRIFDPFFTTKSHGKGVGLGLSISYDLAMKFGGNLKAKNIKPSGSEFTLTLRNG